MQKLALLFLLAITASMVLSLNAVFAQESTETPDDTMTDEEIVDETTDEEVTDEEAMDDTTDEEMADDTAVDETMEDTMTEEETYTSTPLQQLMGGTDPHEITCGEGLQLVFKATNFRPACVKESSYQILLQRGWASSHDPTHEELSAMVDSLPAQETEDATDETTDEPTTEEVNIEEDVNVEEESSTGNGTEPTPQSYSIELAESMDMGAN